MLGSHKLNAHAHFWQPPPKNNWKKIISSRLFILEILSILESSDQIGHIHFWPCPPKKHFDQLYFMQICITMQKIRLFHSFVLEILLIKKSCNLIGWKYFDPYPRNKKFLVSCRTLEKTNDTVSRKHSKLMICIFMLC